MRRIVLPGALPSVLTGVRYALASAWLALVVAETIATSSGIGFLAMDAREFLRTDVIVLAIVIYALIGVAADAVARWLERRLLAWHASPRTTAAVLILQLAAGVASAIGLLSVVGVFDGLLQAGPTPERVRLGRWLFFYKRLSADNTVACATCHRPEHAFSEPTAVSTGIGGQKGRRKAPSLVNQADAPSCHNCGSIMIRSGACYKCSNCGSTSGCS